MAQIYLLKGRRFLPFFITQFLGAFNDNFLKNALVILIAFQISGALAAKSDLLIYLAGGLFILPFFLFSAFAGQLADKFEKTILIRWIKFAEILIMCIAALGFVAETMDWEIYLLLGCLFLMGVHSTFFGPIKYSIIPQHLKPSELVAANGLVGMGTFLAILLGTILGGILIPLQPHGPEIVGAGLIGIAMAGFAICLKIPKAPPPDPDSSINWNLPLQTLEILRVPLRNRPVFTAIFGVSWFWFLGLFFLSVFPIYCRDYLQGKPIMVTFFLTVFSLGIGLGSMLCDRFSRGRVELSLVPVGALGITIFSLLLSVEKVPDYSFFRIISYLSGISLCGGLFIVPLLAYIQQQSDPKSLSRTIAANNILNAFFMVLASAILAILTAWKISIPHMFMTVSILNLMVVVVLCNLNRDFLSRFGVLTKIKTTLWSR